MDTRFTVGARRYNDTGPEDAVIAGILSEHGTPAERLAALEHSAAPELAYGSHPRIDEEAEITTVASYLQAKKRSWRAELASRDAGNAPNRHSWETFQRAMDDVTPGVERDQPVWFLQSDGYRVTGTNQAELNAIAAARDHPAPDDPQQQLGITYQRDTMYAMTPDGAISRHVGAFDAATSADETVAWVNEVVRVHANTEELRLRVTAVVDGGAGNVTMRGTVLDGLLANPTPDLKLVKGLTMLLKAEAESERSQSGRDSGQRVAEAIDGVNPTQQSSDLVRAVRAALNPTPTSSQRVSRDAVEQNPRHRSTGAAQAIGRDR